MSEISSPNRWIPFQCPACHGLFRLRKSQLGQAGRCPTCSAAVRAVDGASSDLGVEAVTLDEEPERLLERISIAEKMTPEEVIQRDIDHKNRKRHHGGPGREGIDWEKKIEEKDKAISWKVVVSLVLSALVLGFAGIIFLNQTTPEAPDTVTTVDESKTRGLLDEIVESQRRTAEEDAADTIVKSVDNYNKFDLLAAEAAAKKFLTARNLEERKRTVRDLERVEPLMDLYYAKVEHEAEGFESFNRAEVSYLGGLLTTVAQTGDFLSSQIALERVLADEGESYKIDWESWVGYCDFTPEEMRSQKPTEPFLMRVLIQPASYYNYGFSDDDKWRSYGLELKDSEYSFLGYTKRDSDLDKNFMLMLKGVVKTSCIVKAAYKPNSRAKDQLEILELVGNGWISNRESFEEDE